MILQAYYRRASANMVLGKFKASLKDYETVSTTIIRSQIFVMEKIIIDLLQSLMLYSLGKFMMT